MKVRPFRFNNERASEIKKQGLLLSISLPNESVGKYLFPRRNKFMASITTGDITESCV